MARVFVPVLEYILTALAAAFRPDTVFGFISI